MPPRTGEAAEHSMSFEQSGGLVSCPPLASVGCEELWESLSANLKHEDKQQTDLHYTSKWPTVNRDTFKLSDWCQLNTMCYIQAVFCPVVWLTTRASDRLQA
jgi:hypothetical protein